MDLQIAFICCSADRPTDQAHDIPVGRLQPQPIHIGVPSSRRNRTSGVRMLYHAAAVVVMVLWYICRGGVAACTLTSKLASFGSGSGVHFALPFAFGFGFGSFCFCLCFCSVPVLFLHAAAPALAHAGDDCRAVRRHRMQKRHPHRMLLHYFLFDWLKLRQLLHCSRQRSRASCSCCMKATRCTSFKPT